MLQTKKHPLYIIVLFIPFLIIVGCLQFPSKGNLTLKFVDIAEKTLTPSINLNASYYTVAGEGPNSSSFTETTGTSSLELNFLEAGTWSITVDAYNAADIRIATGTSSINVVAGETITTSIELLPPEGSGSLFLDVYWDYATVANPTITTSLTPPSDTSISIPSASAGDGHATVSDTAIPTNYYIMSLQLLENGHLLSGAVEAVKILDGQETTGSFTFSDLNLPSGSVSIDITTNTEDPLTITMTGTVDQLVYGETMTITADAGAVTDVNYTWYRNGVSQATGATYTTDSTLAPGTYRLDVIGFTSDGSRAGSVNHTFTVVEN